MSAFRRAMGKAARFLSTTIGQKIAVAVTGLLLSVFLLLHLAGNLLVFAGRSAFNDYAETLQGMGALVWVARVALLTVLAVHVGTAAHLWHRNRGARPNGYACDATVQASHASRTMILSGAIVLVFVALHLLHFTIGAVRPDAFALTEEVLREQAVVARHDAFGMVLAGFHDDRLVAVYLIGMALVGLHLGHGLQSLWQSLGLGPTPRVRSVARAIAWLLAAGFASIVLAVRFDLVS